MSHHSQSDRHCLHLNARGRRCRMLRAPDHESLCAHHLQRSSAAQPDQETLAAELLDSTGDLTSASEVNAFLGNLVRQLARKRIDRKDAIALAYMSQLLLNSLLPLEKQLEAERRAASNRALQQRMEEGRAAYLAQQAAARAQAPQQISIPPGSVAPQVPAAPNPGLPPRPKTYFDVRTCFDLG